MKKKMIISLILCFTIIFSINIPVFASENNEHNCFENSSISRCTNMVFMHQERWWNTSPKVLYADYDIFGCTICDRTYKFVYHIFYTDGSEVFYNRRPRI